MLRSKKKNGGKWEGRIVCKGNTRASSEIELLVIKLIRINSIFT